MRRIIQQPHLVEVKGKDKQKAKEFLNEAAVPYIDDSMLFILPDSYAFEETVSLFKEKGIPYFVAGILDEKTVKQVLNKNFESQKSTLLVDELDKLRKENSRLTQKGLRLSEKLHEMKLKESNVSPELDRILTTAIEEEMDIDTIIDILWFRFSVAPKDAIELIAAYSKDVNPSYDFKEKSLDDILEKAADRLKKKDAVREGKNRRGLTISQDIIDYYEKKAREVPALVNYRHEILWCNDLTEAQKKVMDLKEELADDSLKAVYKFMSSPFSSTTG